VEVLPDDEFSVLRSATEAFVKEYRPCLKTLHIDYTHIERVRKAALQIAAVEENSTTTAEPINIQLVELASLLHDVGDKKFLWGNM
jgi:HD superfamily phosphodiesterase